MQIDYTKVTEEETPIYKKALANAFDYIRDKYPTLCFCGLKINLSSYIGQSHFRHCDKRGWSIKVHNRFKLYLYDRKNCGLKHPKGGITVSLELEATITLIHELTHYAQGVLGGGTYSEIDTTKNSIEYLLMHHPDIHRKLIKTKKPKIVRATPLEKIMAEANKPKVIDMPKQKPQPNKLVAEPTAERKNKKEDEIRVDLSQFAGTYTLAQANIVTEQIKAKANTAIQNKLNPLLEKKKKWLSKLKRAENAIKKLDKSIKYYNKKLLK
jgi:hypothetical protein